MGMTHLDRPGGASGTSQEIPVLGSYAATVRKKTFLLLALAGCLVILAIVAAMVGKYPLPLTEVIRGLLGSAGETATVVLWNVRLPG